MIAPLQIEHQVRILLQCPEAQTRKTQLNGVARRTGLWMAADMAICLLQGVNKAQSSLWRIFAQVEVDCLVDVPISSFARYDRLWLHRAAPRLAAFALRRRLSK